MQGRATHIRTFFSHRRWVGVLCVVVLVTAVICAITYAIVKGPLERWLRDRCVTELTERLGTRVRIDSVGISLSRREVSVYGFMVEDLRRKPMISVDTLCARVGLMPLLDSRIVIGRLTLHGVAVALYKERPDTAANYQFVIDAFKGAASTSGGKSGGKSRWRITLNSASLERCGVRWDVLSAPVRGGDTLDANHVSVDNVRLKVENAERRHDRTEVMLADIYAIEARTGMSLAVDSLNYVAGRDGIGVIMGRISGHYRDKRVGMARLDIRQKCGHLSFKNEMRVRMDTMTYYRDNGRPHKRTGKPHRGYFDAGHINASLSMEAVMQCVTKDSVIGRVSTLSAYDKASGLIIRDLHCGVMMRHDTLTLDSLRIGLQRTVMDMDRIKAHLVKDSRDNSLGVQVKPFRMRGKVYLRDIAKPFAPVLSDFTTPLNLAVMVGGTLDKVTFDSIRVSTDDRRLSLTARGYMLDMMRPRDLRLRFNGIRLNARSEIKETIIRHFSKKIRMKMVQQIKKIGDIRYHGSMGVYFRRQEFSGTLFTKYGAADFAFSINGMKKEMEGSISTGALELGEIMNVKGLGSIRASATYGFSVASRRNSRARHNGRLPVGWMKAQVGSVTYRNIDFDNVSAMIRCDGTTATGEVLVPKSMFDISVLFWYVQTDSIQRLKFKPRLLKNEKASSPFSFIKKWKASMRQMRERRKAARDAANGKKED
ncbi:MAG: hypothetical protein Q4E63_03810 [Prevotellaceae bacterium]|nr:hypothetical protein [Prevotellaceae bacterium]MDO4931766.1 hypothetical protein [Prevotellaceae bacterium]